ncbi:MAG: hypothetical protein CFE23_08360 [Flavobacterium sp. BFFFF1]|uniref:Fic family protein n=1 Tax=Flavobacterium sp. BFFFF1 TaxID=2015557 RepID=UPI000BD2461F|nr:Fic family protein [Flavobacterium sp. BFFFF1]OYU80722.1 MAG: hypothetical protein CFE23_08360 [Flavobacterium sp. BFFFF1]
MELLPIGILKVNYGKIKEIDKIIKSIYRLIIYSRDHLDDDLLDIYLAGMNDLQEMVSIKNAQMEAQTAEEVEEYLQNLQKTLHFVVEEITTQRDFDSEIQLFQLLRLVSPETNAIHPNGYRRTTVQIGGYICPLPALIPQLVSELYYRMEQIENPIVKAIYLHHELIRIHPFADGNGRVTRVAKNWILMFALYPPIFIENATQKKEYIQTLSKSFDALQYRPITWNSHTEQFFEQEIDRILVNANLLYESIKSIGNARTGKRE